MEVSTKRIFLKHLERARPLRRCTQVSEPQINAASCAQTLLEQETNMDMEQFYKTVSLNQLNKDRISYSRDFLIGLASCPEAKKKPLYLPVHPIVLPEARDPGQQELGLVRWSSGNGDV
ncbi:uncharacterized protein C8orf88 homolog [Nematolebias whitei]|uniref:uncharacterized protein C8orf88 homolog n=1 Tax=Nematolebias whitei TaxID=451745 RepID=UPI00189AB7EB|nr:uncharacterized protein C8orf88 homolog [Nematolebias whitei]